MAFHWWQGIVAGGIATAVMTVLMQMGAAMGMTRMSMPLMLGSMFVREPERAGPLGWGLHAMMGLLFGLVYALVFWVVDPASAASAWWIGLLVGAVHGLVVLAVMPVMGAMHPRVGRGGVNAADGEVVLPEFGFGGRGFGSGTPLGIMMGHLVFGLVWGLVFRALI